MNIPDLIKIKNFWTAKETSDKKKKKKRHHADWEKMFANNVTKKQLI